MFPADWDISDGIDFQDNVDIKEQLKSLKQDNIRLEYSITCLSDCLIESVGNLQKTINALQKSINETLPNVVVNSISNSLSNTFSNILTKAKNANRIETQDDPRPVKKFKVTNELPLQFDLDSIKQKYSLTNEKAIQMESVSKGFVNMFFDKKVIRICFVHGLYFEWLCKNKWDLLNEGFLEQSFALLTELKVGTVDVPSDENVLKLKNFFGINQDAACKQDHNEQSPKFKIFQNETEFIQNRNRLPLELGCIVNQIHYIDCINIFVSTSQADITPWAFSYLCICILIGCTKIRECAQKITSYLIRNSSRIPENVFQDGIVFNLFRDVLKSSQESVICDLNKLEVQDASKEVKLQGQTSQELNKEVSLQESNKEASPGLNMFIRRLLKLHKTEKTREWKYFFSTYENVLSILKIKFKEQKQKEQRTFEQFRACVRKQVSSDYNL